MLKSYVAKYTVNVLIKSLQKPGFIGFLGIGLGFGKIIAIAIVNELYNKQPR